MTDNAAIAAYYDNAFDYCNRRITPKRIARWLANVPLPNGDRPRAMLDIGCGVGDSAAWARARGFDWCGTDISTAAIKVGRQLGRNVMHGDGQKLPFADASFDVAVALGSFEHFQDPAAGMWEMNRVLKLNGHAVIFVPSRPIIELLGLYHGTDQMHELRYTRHGWHWMIESAGFWVGRTRRDYGPDVLKDYKPLKIVQRLCVKVTVCLPDCLTYAWIFDCVKKGRD